MEKVYLVREDTGAREDFWPASAHSTWAGAIEGLKAAADRLEIDYSQVTFPQAEQDLFSIPAFDGEMFIQIMKVEN